jgi:type I restriction enzyme S subunit
MSAREAVRPGYKQTEVGVIPEDWEVSTMGDCLSVPPGYGINAPAVAYSSQLPRYIRITDISEDGRFAQANPVSVNSPWSGNYLLDDGDLLFARTGASVGKSYLYKAKDGPLVFAGFLIRAKPDQRKLVPEFISALTNTPRYWSWVRVMSMRSGQPGINGNEYAQFPIPLVPLPEQRAIAAALGDVNALIAALDAAVAKKRDIKQAAMQLLLTGKTRLPGFSGEWKGKRLGDLLEYEQPTKYLVKTGEYSDENDVPVLTAGKTFVLGHTSETHNVFNSLPVIIFDDFTTATKYVTFPFKAKSSAMKLLKPRNGNVNLRLVYELMQLIEFKLSDHKRYWISEYQHLVIQLPHPEEQTAIAKILSDMDAEIAALEAKRNKVRELKTGMMQELLTGRIRLI